MRSAKPDEAFCVYPSFSPLQRPKSTTNLSPQPRSPVKHMTRGKRPAAAIRDAKKFAEKMG
ncbi:MAG: hypothetical protein EHM53_07340 [Methanoregulaceae archaeon]|nr:MAG: hypothetical protein EHM53_07340 [Methanoregulaceae archaeon]